MDIFLVFKTVNLDDISEQVSVDKEVSIILSISTLLFSCLVLSDSL